MFNRTILFRLGVALAAFAILWFLTGSAIVTLVLGALIAALVWVPHHLHGDGNPPPGTTRRQRMKNWWMALRLTFGDVRRQWYRLLDWVQHLLGRADEPPSRFPAARERPAPARPGGGTLPGGDPGLAPLPLDVTPGEIPAVFLPGLAWLRDFEPEDDTHLMGLGRGLGAFELAFAEAIDTALQNCLAPGIRLDPMSVAGMGDYADLRADSAHMAMDIWRRFVTVYDEIKAFRAAGGTLPKDGDFLTDEA